MQRLEHDCISVLRAEQHAPHFFGRVWQGAPVWRHCSDAPHIIERLIRRGVQIKGPQSISGGLMLLCHALVTSQARSPSGLAPSANLRTLPCATLPALARAWPGVRAAVPGHAPGAAARAP